MKKLLTFIFLLIILYGLLLAQRFLIPTTSTYLASTFGEYRGTGGKPHFHMGIDFSTYGIAGKDVLAADDGYVYEVWVNDKIYGNAVILMHPDYGLTTLYAHMNGFAGKIKTVIDNVIKEFGKDKFIRVKFPKNAINIAKGEVIGYSGKTGEAVVPHIHFEVREYRSNEVIVRDPLEFVDYTEKRYRKLELLQIKSEGKKYDYSEENPPEVKFLSYPRITVRIRLKLGENSTVMPKRIALRVNDELVYEIKFDQLYLSEMYNTYPIFARESTMFVYWVKLYSSLKNSFIKINRWEEIIPHLKKVNKAVLILEDPWGRIKKFSFYLVKEM